MPAIVFDRCSLCDDTVLEKHRVALHLRVHHWRERTECCTCSARLQTTKSGTPVPCLVCRP